MNQYAYDAEGRMCATYSSVSNAYYVYTYDADGLRLAKASIAPAGGTAFNSGLCNASGNNYTLVETYSYNPEGQPLQRFTNGQWTDDNIYAGGRLLASTPSGTHRLRGWCSRG